MQLKPPYYCTIKFNSSRGVTRDLKYHFVNSSKGPQLRDNIKNFVNPGNIPGVARHVE